METATRQDITDVRLEMARMWSDLRDSGNKHSEEDDRKFEQVTKAIEEINRGLAEWRGAASLLKWTGGICLPLILGAVVTHLIRHWN